MALVVTVTGMVADKPPLPVTVIVQVPAATGAIVTVPVVGSRVAVANPAQPDRVKPRLLFDCETLTFAGGSLRARNDMPIAGVTATFPGARVGVGGGGEGTGLAVGVLVGVAVGAGTLVGLLVGVGVAVATLAVGAAVGVGFVDGPVDGSAVGVAAGVGFAVGVAAGVGFAVGVGFDAGVGMLTVPDTGSTPAELDGPPPPHAARTTAAALERNKNRNVEPLTWGASRTSSAEHHIAYLVLRGNRPT